MKAVADSGPLIALGKLGLLDLLPRLYDSVIIPPAVYDEVISRGLERGHADAHAVGVAIVRYGFSVLTPSDANETQVDIVNDLSLGEGEKQVIRIGLRESADWVWLDDQLAREEAGLAGLRVRGTVGIIAESYKNGIISIDEFAVALRAVQEREDIWISADLIQHVMNELSPDS